MRKCQIDKVGLLHEAPCDEADADALVARCLEGLPEPIRIAIAAAEKAETASA